MDQRMCGVPLRLGIEIPEADYGQLGTLDSMLDYLVRRSASAQAERWQRTFRLHEENHVDEQGCLYLPRRVFRERAARAGVQSAQIVDLDSAMGDIVRLSVPGY